MTCGSGQSYIFANNGSGGFTSALFCDTVTEENGNTVTVSRNAAGRVTAAADPAGGTS